MNGEKTGGTLAPSGGSGGGSSGNGGSGSGGSGNLGSGGQLSSSSAGGAHPSGGSTPQSGGSFERTGGTVQTGGSAGPSAGGTMQAGGTTAKTGGAGGQTAGTQTGGVAGLGGTPSQGGGVGPAGGNPPGNVDVDKLVGWATMEGGTTGGLGGETVTVATASAFTEAVTKTTPAIVMVSGTIDLGGATVKPQSNKSIIGIGANAGVVGTISFVNVSNIIVRNLTIATPPGASGRDGMNATNSHHIWVDHCSFSECSDGQFDITHGSDYFTVSWCKFSYTNEANSHRLSMLIGNADNLKAEDAGHLKVTLHHNWYGHLVRSRMPLVRYGQVHIFNSYYGAEGSSYNIGLVCSATVLLESSYFEGQTKPWDQVAGMGSQCVQSKIQWNDDNQWVKTTVPTYLPNSTVFTPPYPYTLESGSTVKETVMAHAGVGKGPFAK